MHLIRCLIVIIALTVQTTQAQEIARNQSIVEIMAQVEQQRLTALVTDGVSEVGALARLGAQFTSAADRAFLAAKWPKPTDTITKLRDIKVGRSGEYQITMPNGRSFSVSTKEQLVTVNERPVRMDSAEHFVSDFAQALKITFVVDNGWLGLLRPQTASAVTGMEVIMLGSLAVIVVVGAVKLIGTKASASDAAATVAGWTATCSLEKSTLKMPYQRSETMALITKLGALRGMLKKDPVDCVTFAESLSSRTDVKGIGDYKKTCDMAKAFATCADEYQAESAKKFGSPAQGRSEAESAQ